MISVPDFEKKQIVFVFANNGEKISFKNDNFIVCEKTGEIKLQTTCYRLFMVFVIGGISITSGIIQRANKFSFTICLMTTTMKLYEIIGNRMEGNTLLHKYQYEYNDIGVGRHIIKNKVNNQYRVVNNIRIKSDRSRDTLTQLNEYGHRLDKVDSLNEILGIEGNSAKIYFREVFSTASWEGRQPRIKRDYVNSTMDIGYTILFNVIDSMLQVFGFDTYCGCLHKNFYMRKSLVCDLMEPMRPLIDYEIRKAINYGQCKESDFKLFGSRYVLKWEKSPKYTSFLAKPIMDRRVEIFIYIQSYYRAFMKHKNIEDFPRLEV